MRRRIVFVDDYRPANIGGGERHLLRIARGCREAGWLTSIVCAPGSGLEAHARQDGHEVWPVHTGRMVIRDRQALSALFARLSPDIVHSHGFYATLIAASAARQAEVAHILSTVHNMPSAPLHLHPNARGRLELSLRNALFRRIAQSVDRFVGVVPAVRDELLTIGLDPDKLVVIENGIPDPAIDVRPVAVPAKSGVIRVGSVGRFERPKSYEHFISAAAIVASERDDTEFRLIGDGSLRESLMTQAERLHLRDRIVFAGWSEDPISEIAAMDIYVVSSVTETTNLTVLEAMGLSRPVVATDVGGIADAVTDGVGGYIVPPRREDLLARRICELAADAALRESMGAAGRRRFEESYTEERMITRHLDLYDQLAGA